MKKLIPLLIIAAGAVAYSVYKNKKETVSDVEEEKTFVVIDDTPSDDSHDEPENPIEDVEEAVHEELRSFETLEEPDEPFERPSFFHVTEDSFLEPEKSVEEPAVVIEETEEPVEVVVEEPAEENEVETAEEEPVIEEKSEEVEEKSVEEEIVEMVEEPSVELEDETKVEESVGLELEAQTIIEEPIVENEPEAEELGIEDVIETIAQKVEEASEELPVVEEIPQVIEIPEAEPELEPMTSYDTPEMDELMKTIAGQVKAAEPEEEPVEEEIHEEVKEEPVVEEPVETDFLQDIRKITELYSEKVAQYNIRYPYLSSRFIDDTLKFSQQFNTEYPTGTRVAIEHHAHFTAVEDLFVFAQIIRQAGYHVLEGSEDKTLVVIREMYVDTNTILHDVFKVANQVYCLSGEYLKFRITKR